MVNWTVLLSVVFCMCGCIHVRNASLDSALEMAGDNRESLEKIVAFYEDDVFKREAVSWLIENMPYNHSLEGKALNDYLGYYRLFSQKGKKALLEVDSLQSVNGDFSVRLLTAETDIQNIDLTLLQRNIKQAFRIYDEMPWSVNVSEENFKRYVLPYRICDERLSDWRCFAWEMCRTVTDSLNAAGCDDPLTVARALMRKWNEKEFQWTSQLPSGPAIGIYNLTDKAGTCREFAHGVVYLMRAAGIPSGIDMVPIRGENSASHSWPFIIGKDGKTYVASTENPDFIPASEFDIVAAKIYREEFALNHEIDRSLPSDRWKRPKTFMLPKLRDVTSEYKPNDCLDVELRDIKTDGTPVYLASWGNNRWVAVDYSAGRDVVRFKNVSGGVVSVAARMNDGILESVSAPFEIMSKEKTVRFIKPQKEKRLLTAFAKFPLNARNGELVYKSVGGIIEGSDDPGFMNPDTIFQIDHLAKRRINYVKLQIPSAPHRYYRYYGPDGGHCNIAEVALYESGGNGNPVKGRVFGTSGAYDNDPIHDYDKVFDGDIFTSFDYKNSSGGWSAMDLGRPVSLDKIMFVPRNRDNYVREGDDYELFWFGNCRWNSAGRKIAHADSLNFEVPVGTLYYLKNYSRGRSERIFEYDFRSREHHFW